MVMGILISFGIFESIKHVRTNYIKWFLVLFVTLMLYAGFYNRSNKLVSQSNNLKLRSSDSAIVIGKWLKNNFDENIIIWKDDKVFYIPPVFKNVFSKLGFEDIKEKLSEINEVNPDVLIITCKSDPELKSMHTVTQAIENGILVGFELIKKFKYKGALSYDEAGLKIYKEIYIYVNNNNFFEKKAFLG